MLEQSTTQHPAAREAQKALAYEVTSLVHGEDKALSAKTVTSVLFGGKNLDKLSYEEKRMLASQIPTASAGQNIVSALVETGVATSNGEARRLIQGGAVSVNGKKVTEKYITHPNTLIKKGKNSYIGVL